MFSLGDTCQIISIPFASSLASFVWQAIIFLWSWEGIWILAGVIVWVVVELITRNGTLHYNSKNGFSPPFNIFVGSGLYWGIQSLLLIILEAIFGNSVYCFVWPYPVHAIIFALTGVLLHATGFWPYLKEPGAKKYHKRFRGRRRMYR